MREERQQSIGNTCDTYVVQPVELAQRRVGLDDALEVDVITFLDVLLAEGAAKPQLHDGGVCTGGATLCMRVGQGSDGEAESQVVHSQTTSSFHAVSTNRPVMLGFSARHVSSLPLSSVVGVKVRCDTVTFSRPLSTCGRRWQDSTETDSFHQEAKEDWRWRVPRPRSL